MSEEKGGGERANEPTNRASCLLLYQSIFSFPIPIVKHVTMSSKFLFFFLPPESGL